MHVYRQGEQRLNIQNQAPACVFIIHSVMLARFFTFFLVPLNLRIENIQVISEQAKVAYSFTIYSLQHY